MSSTYGNLQLPKWTVVGRYMSNCTWKSKALWDTNSIKGIHYLASKKRGLQHKVVRTNFYYATFKLVNIKFTHFHQVLLSAILFLLIKDNVFEDKRNRIRRSTILKGLMYNSNCAALVTLKGWYRRVDPWHRTIVTINALLKKRLTLLCTIKRSLRGQGVINGAKAYMRVKWTSAIKLENKLEHMWGLSNNFSENTLY